MPWGAGRLATKREDVRKMICIGEILARASRLQCACCNKDRISGGVQRQTGLGLMGTTDLGSVPLCRDASPIVREVRNPTPARPQNSFPKTVSVLFKFRPE